MLRALLKTMRPKQWAKNVFLLAALVFDRKLTNVEAIFHTILGVIAFSLVASVVYIVNDIADVEADRQHRIGLHPGSRLERDLIVHTHLPGHNHGLGFSAAFSQSTFHQ